MGQYDVNLGEGPCRLTPLCRDGWKDVQILKLLGSTFKYKGIYHPVNSNVPSFMEVEMI